MGRRRADLGQGPRGTDYPVCTAWSWLRAVCYYYYSVKPAFVAQSDVRSWHIPGCDANSRKQAPLPLVVGGTDYPKCLGGREHTTVQPQGALPAAQGSR